ncbi:MAG: putative Ig domain-containing protein [Synergistaceae bacterium]|nr:putative Ig domain-containing protein [Synergistaceae bacterium]
MKSGEFPTSNTIEITKDVSVYGGFTDSDTSIASRTGTTTIKAGTSLNGRVMTIDNSSVRSYILLDGLTITGGKATNNTNGGGVYVNENAIVDIINCTITGNEVSNGDGGGLYANKGSIVDMTNCTITSNKAGSNGGGIYVAQSAKVDMTNCTVTNNTTSNGGGFYAYDYSILTLTNCTIANNTATSNGGGLYAYEPILTLTNCTVANNTATSNGGGLYIYKNSILTLTNCTVANNTGANGKEIYNAGRTTMTNTFVWNSATDSAIINNTHGTINASYCAAPIQLDGEENIAITSWESQSSTTETVNGVNHTVYKIENNSELSGLEGKGTSEGAPEKDQLGNTRSSPPCIGAVEKVYTPKLSPAGTLTINAIEGKAIDSTTITATKGAGIVWSATGELPAGLTAASSDNTCTISGVPETGTSANTPYNYTITATNSKGSDDVTVTVNVSAIPMLSYSDTLTLTEGEAMTDFKITAIAGSNLTWFTNDTLPSGLTGTGNDKTYTISGTPARGTAGTHSYTVKATSTSNTACTATATITITIKAAAEPTLLDSAVSYTAEEGSEISPIRIIATSGSNLTWSGSGSLPSGLTVSSQDNVFTISGTPAEGTASGSPYDYTVKVTNIAGTKEAQVTITVNEESPPVTPVFLDSSINYTCLEGVEISPIRIFATEGNKFTWSESGNLPDGLTTLSQGNIFTIYGTPSTGTSGSYTYTVKAANSLGNAEASVTITVKTIGSNSSPSAPVLLESEINYTGLENWEISPIKIIAMSGNNLEWSSSGTLPDGLQVSRQSNIFTIYGTPSTGTSGSYTYTVKAANSLGNAEAKITITIKTIGSGFSQSAPVLLESEIKYTGLENWEISPIKIIAMSGNNLEWSSSGTLPDGLQVSRQSNIFTIYGTPSTGTSGSYTYTVKAANSLGSAEAKITITVKTMGSNSSPSAPVLLESEIKYTGLENWEISPIKVIAMSGNNLEWSSSGTLPEGLQVSRQSNIFTIYGTPSTGTSGSYTYTVKAANSLGSAEARITITVKGSSAKPILSESAITYINQEGYTIKPIIIKAATGDNLAWSSSGSLPAGLSGAESGDKTGYIISGILAIGTAGRYSCTVTAKNDIGEASTLVTIIVEAFELEGLYEPSENTNLEDYLLNTLDLSREQLYTITSLKVFANITSLHGIAELVPNLKTLDLTEAYSLSGDLDLGVLGDLELDEVDISGNPALKTLALRDCIITRVNAEGCENLVSIDVAGNESIEELILDNTNISTINARDCKNLITLHFANSRVTKMDLTGCDELQDLDFRANSVRRFHIDQFGLRRLETLDAAGQEVYVPLIEKVFNFAEFLTGYDNDYDAYSSGTTADTSDHNLGEVTAYDESGNEIDYDDSKYKQTGEFIFDKAPARIVYEYETGLTSMDVTITGTHDDDSGAGLGGSGGCNSGLANWALLALVWLVLNYQGGYTFL